MFLFALLANYYSTTAAAILLGWDWLCFDNTVEIWTLLFLDPVAYVYFVVVGRIYEYYCTEYDLKKINNYNANISNRVPSYSPFSNNTNVEIKMNQLKKRKNEEIYS